MNAYRLPVRTYVPHGIHLYSDLAINRPPGDLEPLFLKHSLVPYCESIAAIGRFNTDKEAEAAHSDVLLLIHVVDRLGLKISEDQSTIYRDRKTAALFNQPLLLEDDEENMVVLDHRPRDANYSDDRFATWFMSDPVKLHGWETAYIAGYSDGSQLRISSPTLDIVPLFDRVELWLDGPEW